MNKKGFFTGIIILGILLVVGFFWFVGEMNGEEEEVEDVCEVDSDCVKVQTGCCACSSGGTEKCVAKSFESNYLEMLENCSELTVCAQVFNCEIESCGCVDGRCVG